MTDRQLDLEGEEHDPDEEQLTVAQLLLLTHVRESYDGVSADEAGAFVHSRRLRPPHGPDARCRWCGRDGRAALEALQRHGMVRKATGLTWKPTDREETPQP